MRSYGMALFMDQALACRLERTESAIGASFIRVRQHREPEVGTLWQDFDGIHAIFDGASSPFSQTFGLGLFAPLAGDTVARIEAFFAERGAATMHEVSPFVSVETMGMLAERGYRPIELSTILVQELDDRIEVPAPAGLRARVIEEADETAWIDASVDGWSSDPAVAGSIRSIAETAVHNRELVHFLVERDASPIATGSLGVHDGVALLAGASTVPWARGLGAQGLLLGARLVEARRRGCEVAMMAATPGSTSQRNAERRGFRVAYSRTKWRRPAEP